MAPAVGASVAVDLSNFVPQLLPFLSYFSIARRAAFPSLRGCARVALREAPHQEQGFRPEYLLASRRRERLGVASRQRRPVARRGSPASGAARGPCQRPVSRRGQPLLPARNAASSLGRELRDTPRWRNPRPGGRPACVTCGIVSVSSRGKRAAPRSVAEASGAATGAASSAANSCRFFCTQTESRTLNICARARPRSDMKCSFKGSRAARSAFGNLRLNACSSIKATSRSRARPNALNTPLNVARILSNAGGRKRLKLTQRWHPVCGRRLARSCNSSGSSPNLAPGSCRCQAAK